MRPDAQQMLAAPPPVIPDWYELDLLFGLGVLDLGVLLVIGVAVSATAWVITEGLKERGRLPTTAMRQWAPVVICEGIAVWLFPLTLEGVAPEHTMPLWAAVAVAILLGLAGGFGAQAAHRWAEGLMQALFGWAIGKFAGSSGEGTGGG